MKVILTNQGVIDIVNSLSKISQLKLPIKLSYAIAKTLQKLEDTYKPYDKEKTKIDVKYPGEGNAKGINWANEINELLLLTNEVDIDTIVFSDLEYDTEKYDVIPFCDVKALLFMIVQ